MHAIFQKDRNFKTQYSFKNKEFESEIFFVMPFYTNIVADHEIYEGYELMM